MTKPLGTLSPTAQNHLRKLGTSDFYECRRDAMHTITPEYLWAWWRGWFDAYVATFDNAKNDGAMSAAVELRKYALAVSTLVSRKFKDMDAKDYVLWMWVRNTDLPAELRQ